MRIVALVEVCTKLGHHYYRESPFGRQVASRCSDSASPAGKCACVSRSNLAIAGLTLPTDAAVEKVTLSHLFPMSSGTRSHM